MLQGSPNLSSSASPVSRRALKFSLKSVASADSATPARGCCLQLSIIRQGSGFYTPLRGADASGLVRFADQVSPVIFCFDFMTLTVSSLTTFTSRSLSLQASSRTSTDYLIKELSHSPMSFQNCGSVIRRC